MAKTPFTQAYLSINGTDLSNQVETVLLTVTADDIDVTAMQDGAHRHIAGLQDNKLAVTYWNDYSTATSVGKLHDAMLAAGTAVPFRYAKGPTPFGTANPIYSGSVLLITYPVGGKVGDGFQTAIQYVVDGSVSFGGTV